jgi:hypothetical protein
MVNHSFLVDNMCRVSSLMDPPRVAQYKLNFPHEFEGTSSYYCDCQTILLPNREDDFKVRDRPEILRLNLPLQKNIFESSIFEEKRAQVLEKNLDTEGILPFLLKN